LVQVVVVELQIQRQVQVEVIQFLVPSPLLVVVEVAQVHTPQM
jgi:hypothetical protein